MRMFAAPKLNTYQQKVLDQLARHYKVVSAYSFSGKDWFNSQVHCDLFLYLVKNLHCSLSEAFDAMKDLNAEQTKFIYDNFDRGIRREDVMGLAGVQLFAMRTFKRKGLTNAVMRQCPWFNSDSHYQAMVALVLGARMRVTQALATLQDLSADQAEAINLGLSRAEVLGLNMAQQEALILYKYKGLSFETISHCAWFNADYHVKALQTLVTKYRFDSFAVALDYLEALTPEEVNDLDKSAALATADFPDDLSSISYASSVSSP